MSTFEPVNQLHTEGNSPINKTFSSSIYISSCAESNRSISDDTK